ncbi:MAG: hypothetical protein M3O78_03850, partial [Chloroflexota bacterium]|nr:hypothetical protein [Chloroflexota bacterium]
DRTGSDWPESDFAARDEQPAQRDEARTPQPGEPTPDDPSQANDPPPPGDPPPSDPPPSDPPHDEPSAATDTLSPETEAGEVTTSGNWDPRLHGERRRPTTAEQAVPWLIGLILALSGVCVVLLALIFTGPQGLVAIASPTPSPSITPSASIAATPSTSPSVSPSAQATASPPPSFGPLEMVYIGEKTAGGQNTLLRRDFSTKKAAVQVAALSGAVSKAAGAPDGRIGAVTMGGVVVALAPGTAPRAISNHVTALAFGDDSTTLYALRITAAGNNDQTQLLAINAYTGATRTVATITYPHPVTFADPPLTESQFQDNGGLDRLYATTDGYVVAWILAAPNIYQIDPATGTVVNVQKEPTLWSPDQSRQVEVAKLSVGNSRLILRDRAGKQLAAVNLIGLASHVRWAGTENEVVFTLGQYGANYVVLQNLYVWDLTNGKAPSPLTSDNTSRGAEWLGVPQAWLP